MQNFILIHYFIDKFTFLIKLDNSRPVNSQVYILTL